MLFIGGGANPETTARGTPDTPDCGNDTCELGFTKSASSCSWICSTVLTRCARCAISSFAICECGARSGQSGRSGRADVDAKRGRRAPICVFVGSPRFDAWGVFEFSSARTLSSWRRCISTRRVLLSNASSNTPAVPWVRGVGGRDVRARGGRAHENTQDRARRGSRGRVRAAWIVGGCGGYLVRLVRLVPRVRPSSDVHQVLLLALDEVVVRERPTGVLYLVESLRARRGRAQRDGGFDSSGKSARGFGEELRPGPALIDPTRSIPLGTNAAYVERDWKRWCGDRPRGARDSRG